MTRFTAATVLAAASVLSMVAFAGGDAKEATAAPATIVPVDGTCAFLDANGDLWKDPGSTGQIVYSNDTKGMVNVTCGGQLPAGAALPKKAVHYDQGTGFVCAGEPEATWKMIITPSGKAHFTCHKH